MFCFIQICVRNDLVDLDRICGLVTCVQNNGDRWKGFFFFFFLALIQSFVVD